MEVRIMNSGPALTAANIRYLLAIEDLDRNGKGVRCVDVAQALGITKPSVHSMVDSMKDMGLLEKPRYGVIRLTDLGRSTADRYQVYFQTICRHFAQFLPQRQDVLAAAFALLSELKLESVVEMCTRIADADAAPCSGMEPQVCAG